MYEPLKGFRDFYPEEMEARREVIETVESVVRRYGFREIGTPALEPTALYVDKSGPEIVEELYSFTDRGGREVALTPELTPTVARMVAARHQAMTKPIKWYSTRPFWRYEEPQQARFREFYQTNIDIFGSVEPTADAEILAVCGDLLTELGLERGDFEFRVSHRDILGELVRWVDPTADVAAAIRAIDRTDGAGWEATVDELVDAGLEAGDADTLAETLAEASDDLRVLRRVDRPAVDEAVDELAAVLEAAEEFGARRHCRLSLSTARGLDYYTGVVFECFDTQGEIGRSIFGGGRYDDLIASVGGPDMPAVGVAPGLAPLSLMLQRAGVWPSGTPEVEYFVLHVGGTRAVAADIARTLRERGHRVAFDVAGRNFGGQLEYADAVGARTTVIVGERDLADDVVTVKDMATGDQERRPVAEFLDGAD
ncbi:MAG: histidine--tRNA ligase [Halobacteriota archaeon]